MKAMGNLVREEHIHTPMPLLKVGKGQQAMYVVGNRVLCVSM